MLFYLSRFKICPYVTQFKLIIAKSDANMDEKSVTIVMSFDWVKFGRNSYFDPFAMHRNKNNATSYSSPNNNFALVSIHFRLQIR